MPAISVSVYKLNILQHTKMCAVVVIRNIIYKILTKHCYIGRKHPWRMRWHLTHVQAGVFFLHWIYVQTPIIRILEFYTNPRIATVRIIADC